MHVTAVTLGHPHNPAGAPPLAALGGGEQGTPADGQAPHPDRPPVRIRPQRTVRHSVGVALRRQRLVEEAPVERQRLHVCGLQGDHVLGS